MDKEKQEALIQEMVDLDLDAILLRDPENILYTTGYWPVLGWTFFTLRNDGHSAILIPESELNFLDRDIVDEVRILEAETLAELYDPYRQLASFIHDLGIKDGSRVGCELTMETLAVTHVPELSFAGYKTCQIIRDKARSALVDFSDTLLELRTVKNRHEIDGISKACEIAGLGLEEARHQLREGITEAELASAIERTVYAKGVGHNGVKRARGYAFVMSGNNASNANMPFNISSDRKIAKGESILIELNVQADGFWADLTRTWFIGEPTSEIRRRYEAVLEANEKAARYAADGVGAKQVDNVAREVISSKGFGAEFNHRLGHGIGFRLHEPPSLHPASNETIKQNMTFTIEPGVYGKDYGIRVEDVVLAGRSNGIKLSRP